MYVFYFGVTSKFPLFHSSGHYTIHDCHYKMLKSSFTKLIITRSMSFIYQRLLNLILICCVDFIDLRQQHILMTSSVDENCLLVLMTQIWQVYSFSWFSIGQVTPRRQQHLHRCRHILSFVVSSLHSECASLVLAIWYAELDYQSQEVSRIKSPTFWESRT